MFADIDPRTLNLDPDKAAAAITPRTKAIVAVEAFGNPAGMIELEQVAQKNELILIEDACEGFGGQFAKRAIGSFGRAAVFGFYPNKQITTGEGGMIVTDDDIFAELCRSLRNQGRGGNELAGAMRGWDTTIGSAKSMRRWGSRRSRGWMTFWQNRRRVAQAYMERLMTNRYLILPTLMDDTHMSWFVFRGAVERSVRAGGSGSDYSRVAVGRGSGAAIIFRRFICSRMCSKRWARRRGICRFVNTSRHGRWRCRFSRG